MNPYATLVADYARHYREGRTFPLGGFPAATHPTPAAGAPVLLIFSPHPDDECIVGGLPLRLRRQAGWRIVNVAVTLGSNRARQSARAAELANACRYIGFDLCHTSETGLEGVNPKTRAKDPAVWAKHVDRILEILAQFKPQAVLFPHETDWNSTHIGVHWLLRDALEKSAQAGDPFSGLLLIESEYWGQMQSPNLMVESSIADVTDLVTAVSFHVGEVQRNPFHLRLPAWMQDNVRLGSEVVGGQGEAAPDYDFATLYRVGVWRSGKRAELFTGGRRLASQESPLAAFATA